MGRCRLISEAWQTFESIVWYLEDTRGVWQISANFICGEGIGGRPCAKSSHGDHGQCLLCRAARLMIVCRAQVVASWFRSRRGEVYPLSIEPKTRCIQLKTCLAAQMVSFSPSTMTQGWETWRPKWWKFLEILALPSPKGVATHSCSECMVSLNSRGPRRHAHIDLHFGSAWPFKEEITKVTQPRAKAANRIEIIDASPAPRVITSTSCSKICSPLCFDSQHTGGGH